MSCVVCIEIASVLEFITSQVRACPLWCQRRCCH